ncbi:MAG: FimB/Mfa2 family fimbrial subunit [Rikenellaceae bacterium]|nr:FimB/Mfa2 family fimbrial subunit [Rikenellaceae bacterium]
MKFTKLFMTGAAVISLLAMSCSTDNGSDQKKFVEEGEGDLKITLVGDDFTRAEGPSSYAAESAVKKFTVYVFNAENNALEATQTFTNVTTATMSGLSTGFPKKIVVVTNTPSNFPVFYEGDDYSKLTQASSSINLTYQTPANIETNGLVMLGETESPVTISLTGTTVVPISLRRLVAKVTLGTIKILPLGNFDIDEFELTGVSIQRAISSTDIYGNAISSSSLYGGLIGSMSLTQQSFLYDAINTDFEVAVEENMGNYFYVLPNQNRDECTLLTLVSNYEGDEQYFPIPINAEEGDKNTDGTLIQANKSYIINIVINNLGKGTTDPDIPPTTAPIEVKLTVEPWDLDIIQDVVW